MFEYGGFKFFLIKISAGAVFLVFGMFMIISLGTYDTSDPGLGKLQSFGGTKNFFGYFGARAVSPPRLIGERSKLSQNGSQLRMILPNSDISSG